MLYKWDECINVDPNVFNFNNKTTKENRYINWFEAIHTPYTNVHAKVSNRTWRYMLENEAPKVHHTGQTTENTDTIDYVSEETGQE